MQLAHEGDACIAATRPAAVPTHHLTPPRPPRAVAAPRPRATTCGTSRQPRPPRAATTSGHSARVRDDMRHPARPQRPSPPQPQSGTTRATTASPPHDRPPCPDAPPHTAMIALGRAQLPVPGDLRHPRDRSGLQLSRPQPSVRGDVGHLAHRLTPARRPGAAKTPRPGRRVAPRAATARRCGGLQARRPSSRRGRLPTVRLGQRVTSRQEGHSSWALIRQARKLDLVRVPTRETASRGL